MWYAAAVVIGLGLGATSTVTVAPTIQNWFHKKTGFAIGMVWAIQSLFVALLSPAFTALIEAIGWRPSYLVLAAVSAAICFPCCAFLIRYKPAEGPAPLRRGRRRRCRGSRGSCGRHL